MILAVDFLKGREASQSDPDELEDWVVTNHMNFKKGIKFCTWNRETLDICVDWLHDRMESSLTEGGLGCPGQQQIEAELAVCPGRLKDQLCPWMHQANSTAIVQGEELCCAPLQECCCAIWAPQHKKDTKLFQGAQRKSQNMVTGLEARIYVEQLTSNPFQ